MVVNQKNFGKTSFWTNGYPMNSPPPPPTKKVFYHIFWRKMGRILPQGEGDSFWKIMSNRVSFVWYFLIMNRRRPYVSRYGPLLESYNKVLWIKSRKFLMQILTVTIDIHSRIFGKNPVLVLEIKIRWTPPNKVVFTVIWVAGGGGAKRWILTQGRKLNFNFVMWGIAYYIFLHSKSKDTTYKSIRSFFIK